LNPAGVEFVHWKPADIDSSSLIVVHIQNNTELGVGTHQSKGCLYQSKGCLWGQNPTTKSFWWKLLVEASGGSIRRKHLVEASGGNFRRKHLVEASGIEMKTRAFFPISRHA